MRLSYLTCYWSMHHAEDDLTPWGSGTAIDSCKTDLRISNATNAKFDSFSKLLSSMVPSVQQFDKNYTNPCWYMPFTLSSSTQKYLQIKTPMTDTRATRLLSKVFGRRTTVNRLYCIPKVFLIGFPKSGSTTLYNLIVRHPLIVGGVSKEPHWWTRYPYVNKFPQNILALLKYLAQYYRASEVIQRHPTALAIDGSQSTIWDTRTSSNLCDIPNLISSLVPDGRYIVVMREPVSRLYSDFAYLCSESYHRRLHAAIPHTILDIAPNVFDEVAVAKLKKFEGCVEKYGISLCTHYSVSGSIHYTPSNATLPQSCMHVRVGISLYHVHIARWLQLIPREQFLFLRMEDLSTDPYSVLKEVWQFLGVKELSREVLGAVLYEHSNTNPLSHKGVERLKPETRAALHEFFQPFNKKLAELLDDDRFLWADT